ncbi:hypothetical protein AQJ43_09545 [Streptomyces avermitilis]|uniref:ATP/GTP-binding protein n=3 Tax=Streptomyces TaxID=1883 RepID=Q82NA3_STRAW|nr:MULTISPECIES: hypothetical protein [Streptomyces]KUN55176.1 hypothetical protein AQJ43_09545 [Streptomyces avermitilis]MYS97029.1 hypothetical protein [Streptomyces sp. SID5469]OOV26718.1 hypothetical protein SM007_23040 [Streptomyces avermitilis]BAC69110.1 hypothetical protein SAVERM_1400 [Streptomyces avermitilis MA-4680 = NBRC 14893]BBJ49057.1 hypothetical protein SAVMC3_16860 [Streptomyces avermitilis]
MTDEHSVFEYKIGLLAPSRVGKSTLIAGLLTEGQQQLAQDSSVHLLTADRPTKNRLAATYNLVSGALKARMFEPGLVPSTSDPSWFRLLLEARGQDLQIRFDILDYPGAWLEGAGEGTEDEQKWNECEAFLADSSVLILPIDSVLLMDSGDDHAHLLASHLSVFQINQAVLRWAKNRRELSGEPAMIVFCPVKCETYLSDSGSLQDHAGTLRGKVVDQFSDVLKTVRDAAPHAAVRYLPIDTFGCVELVSARWIHAQGSPGGEMLVPKYRVRPPGQIVRKGLDDLLTLLCRQLVDTARAQSERTTAAKQTAALNSRNHAELREGFFRDLWLNFNGERNRRRHTAATDERLFAMSQRTTQSLFDVLTALAGRESGPRLHHLS